MDQITSGLRKLLLAGIGAAAIAKEKGGEVLELLSKRGEVTVEQGKVLNEELKRNLKETVRENVETARENVETVKESVKESLKDNVHVIYPEDDLMNAVDGMDEEQLAALKERIAARERAGKTAEETEAKDEDEKDGSAE